MSLFEALSTLAALVALVISLVALVRSRQWTAMQIELSRVSAQLAEKQLDRLVADESVEGQPTFAIRVLSVAGIGDFAAPDYEVRIRIAIESTGAPYLEPRGVSLAMLDSGIYRRPEHAELEFEPGRLADIEREHTIKVRRGADLLACSLHVRYLDAQGSQKTQQFRVILSGRPGDYLPMNIFFPLDRISTLVPGSLWSLR